MAAKTTTTTTEDSPTWFTCLGLMSLVVVLSQVALFASSLLLMAANVWMIVEISPGVRDTSGGMAVVIRLFNAVLCGLQMASLFDLKWIVTYAYFLMTYVGSGIFAMFVGVLTLGAQDVYQLIVNNLNDQNVQVDITTIDSVRTVSGWLMVGVGIGYVFLGAFQFPHLSRRREFIHLSRNSLNGSRSSGLNVA